MEGTYQNISDTTDTRLQAVLTHVVIERFRNSQYGFDHAAIPVEGVATEFERYDFLDLVDHIVGEGTEWILYITIKKIITTGDPLCYFGVDIRPEVESVGPLPAVSDFFHFSPCSE